jgi:hypothetical protein
MEGVRLKEMGHGVVFWIHLAQEKNQWRSFVKT